MSRTLLVPTDLSARSRPGVRFAAQLAEQAGYALVFFYNHSVLRPTRWSEKRYQEHLASEQEKATRDLRYFIRNAYRNAPGSKPTIRFLVHLAPDAGKAIVDAAREIDADAICMSSRGAGGLRKLLGSNAAYVIGHSPIPVFVLPQGYRRRPVRNIFYASDFNALGKELKFVKQFARLFEARIIVYHYDPMADVPEVRRKLQKAADKYRYADVSFRIQKMQIGKSLVVHIERDMRSCSASLAVLFTDQNRSWFDKLFMSSNSVKAAYNTTVPLLIAPKR